MGVARLRQELQSHKRIFLDTMILAYVLDDHPQYAGLAVVILSAIEQGELEGVISSVTLAELLTAPAQAGDEQALQDYELYLSNFPNLLIQPFDTSLARLAARVRATTRLKMPDAILVATARQLNADLIVSNDKAWRGKTGSTPLLVLDDFLTG